MARAQLGRYSAEIGYLQRSELDTQGLRIAEAEVSAALRTAVDLGTPLPIWMVQVLGVTRSWEAVPADRSDGGYMTDDILAGLHGQGTALSFLVRGAPRQVQIHLGTMDPAAGAGVRALFESQYPGGQIWPAVERGQSQASNQQWAAAAQRLQALRAFLAGCRHSGVVTGLPMPKPNHSAGGGTQLDRLLRGLYGSDWALLVLASPAQDTEVVTMQLAILQEKTRVEQEEGFRERRERAGQSVAAFYYQLLDMQQQILEACLYEGAWWTQVYVCSPDEAAYQRAKALVKSIYSGDYGRVDRMRVLDCPGAGRKVASFSPIIQPRPTSPSFELPSEAFGSYRYHTLLASSQLSAWIHLPRQEVPGYFVRESVPFDVSSHVPPGADSVSVGEILDRGRRTGNGYQVRVEDLTKHALVVGITGSGKTNTTFYLLQQLQRREQPVPFLVLEPAKREYRALARLLPKGQALRVFTIGEEGPQAAPFRLNPFEIRPGVSVQTHINLLKSVFNASFGMWTPLPQILERAIHEVYRDKGWDPVRDSNDRAAMDTREGRRWHAMAQPTLSDLQARVRELVPKLGYEKEVAGNIQTALETRINSLRVGRKGLMLDTALSIPIEHLLASPTVLELEGVGDDDERAFLMGLVLMMLYEYYQTQGEPGDGQLRHLTVIEEAHRLLAQSPPNTSPEEGNVRGKAVETFVNMLSEVRAYGEGFLIAEQIPTKLAPDVIKNTALKVMHRVVANDDRVAMGGAMNLSPDQVRQVVALGIGQAVVHGGGRYADDGAMLVQAPLAKGNGRDIPTGTDIHSDWQRFRDAHQLQTLYLSYPTCRLHCLPANPACLDARRIAEEEAVAESFAAFGLSLVAGSLSREGRALASLASTLFEELRQVLRSHLSGPAASAESMGCLLTHALYRYLERRGAQYQWAYQDTARLASELLPTLQALAAGREVTGPALQKLVAFCRSYVQGCRFAFPPFSGCIPACGRQPLCLYRFAVEPLLADEELDADFGDARPEGQSLAEVCEAAAERALAWPEAIPQGSLDIHARQTAALCYLIQKTHGNLSEWPRANRQMAIESLLAYYGRLGEA